MEQYRLGAWVRILIPAVSETEWHPFTVNVVAAINTQLESGSTQGGEIVVMCRSLGRWTNKLMVSALKDEISSVLVIGPYGGMSIDSRFLQYKRIVLVAGGIGITPMISILQYYGESVQRSSSGTDSVNTSNLQSLVLVWCVREPELLQVPFIKEVLEKSSQLQQIRIVVYLTGNRADNASRNVNNQYQEDQIEIKKGRPLLEDYISEVKNLDFVFTCGPATLQESVEKLSYESSVKNVRTETFEL